ncbi:ANR family transcriptional regulator, partial [Enterobacter asburiae]
MSAFRQQPAAPEAPPAPGLQRDSQAYYPWAREAQHLEQAGEYARASKAWTQASCVSCNQINRNWSERRAEFCVKQNVR